MKVTVCATEEKTLLETLEQAKTEGYVLNTSKPWYDVVSRKYYMNVEVISKPTTETTTTTLLN